MVTVEELCPHHAMQLKQVRLTALKDTPSAFGSTYTRESNRTDEDWIRLASAWNGQGSVFYIAIEHGEPCGMIGGTLDEEAPRRAWVRSMWVAPAHRRMNLGTRLMDAVQRWAQRAGMDELRLMVTSNNAPALAFYEKCGFLRTGMKQPYDNDPSLFKFEMSRAIQSR
jgi:ribosomal protein S18 acetylase RimI-like enzyme